MTGIDISAALIAKGAEAERRQPAGIGYLQADAAAAGWLPGAQFDAAVCSFGLSDIDDLDGALASVARVTRAGGRFVFSILHPCFPGGQDVSGAWPTMGSYYDEGWWRADGAASWLRRQVGANHRTLSTYLSALRRHGLRLDALLEPAPPPEWARARPEAARMPVFLTARCLRQYPRVTVPLSGGRTRPWLRAGHATLPPLCGRRSTVPEKMRPTWPANAGGTRRGTDAPAGRGCERTRDGWSCRLPWPGSPAAVRGSRRAFRAGGRPD